MIEKIRDTITAAYPDIEIEIEMEGSHFHVTAVGTIFEGLSRLKRQQLFNKVFKPLIQEGVIHAINYTLLTPNENKIKEHDG